MQHKQLAPRCLRSGASRVFQNTKNKIFFLQTRKKIILLQSMKRTVISISKATHQKLRIRSAVLGIKIGEAAEKAVELWLQKNKGKDE